MRRLLSLPRAIAARALTITLATFLAVTPLPAGANDDPWPDLRKELFADRPIEDNSPLFTLFAPTQAMDPALVPISVRFPSSTAARVKSMTLLIDRNPAPVVAAFRFGDAFRDSLDIGERLIETRVRIDSFSKVRAVVETDDGKLHMVAKFLAAAGGCASISDKDPALALEGLGRVRVEQRRDQTRDPHWRDARIMIKHPNFTGMQMNLATRAYTPARFVETLEVKRGGKLVFDMTGGISVSENPNVRFTFGSSNDEPIEITAKDTEGTRMQGSSADSGS